MITKANNTKLQKAPTGVNGLDDILDGGLPRGRPTLVCGGTGCGKTILSMEFLVRGAVDFDEPGVFIAFEETAGDLAANVASLGFDLGELEQQKKIAVDHVHLAREEIVEAGEFDLEGLFIRIKASIDEVKAKRVVLDTVEAVFAHLPRPDILRAELHRLFNWLKQQGVTAIITGEQGEGRLTRHGIEEYVSDCVLFLDHRVTDQVSTRRLRVVKYRGSTHGHNEYPFMIDEGGFWVMPVTSIASDVEVSEERISSGVPRLDTMLGGGWYRGSGVLISGTAGTGKSSLGAALADATCARGERVLYVALEEPVNQVLRNMRSIGIDLAPWMDKGLLRFNSTRPEQHGLEMHLGKMMRAVNEFEPHVVIVDPISAWVSKSALREASLMLVRLMDFLKSRQITAVYNHLTSGGAFEEATDASVSSVIDAWLLLRDVEYAGERNRAMHILKCRGTGHSNQIREFLLSDQGIDLIDVYTGPEGVLTGSARKVMEAREAAAQTARQAKIEQMKKQMEQKKLLTEAKIAALRAELDGEQAEVLATIEKETALWREATESRKMVAASRHADTGGE